ncbi:NAD-dependent epimerase/dehydratase family protein [Acidobacteriota bacterium]
MKIFVIGGTGFIGPFVVRKLYEKGHDVTVFHRGKTEGDLPSEVTHLYDPSLNLGDRQCLESHRDELKRLAPDVVLDMIPVIEQDAKTVMQVFDGIARRVVAISSQDVYRGYGKLIGIESGPIDAVPLSEDAPLREKLYPYRSEDGRAEDDPRRWMDHYEKILIERVYTSEPALPGTVLRLPMVYGPGDKQHRLFEYLKRMDDNRPVIILSSGMAKWRWTRGYVGNVAEAIACAVLDERSAGRIYNAGEKETGTMAGWVKEIGDFAGWPGKVCEVPEISLPDSLQAGFNTDQHLVASTDRIRDELGYQETVSREDGLKRTIEWERENPPRKIDPAQFDYAAEDAFLAEWRSG